MNEPTTSSTTSFPTSSSAVAPSAVDAFLAGARAAVAAIGSDEVAAKWNEPSVLEGQHVGSLAGHLARGGTWVTLDYLAAGEPAGVVSFDSAGEYFATFVDRATEADHQAIRQRGAEISEQGHREVFRLASEALATLEQLLPTLSPDRRITVIAGAVMRLEDYLVTRVVEQVVHLDDLGRSVNVEFAVPEEGQRIAADVALDVARRRVGSAALIRSLYRAGFAEGVFPVL